MTAEHEVSRGTLADDPSAQQAWCQGRIALHLRVGVTGHRDIDPNDPVLVTGVRYALQFIEARCRKGTAATPVNLTVVSALAEGADRIVAQEAIEHGASLEVVLPMPLDDYLTDFKSDQSRSEFCTLLVDHASAITELAAISGRDEAYEQAGRTIVDRSDVLIALWDGQAARGPGGTAEIASYARRQGVHVLQVPVERLDPGSPHARAVSEAELPESFTLLSDSAFKQLDRYNSSSLRTRRKGSQNLLLPPEFSGPMPPHVQSLVNYAQPYFNRAEQVARSSQNLFVQLTRLLYSLAAAAVILVATQVIFFGHDPQIVWAEVVVLATVVVALILGRRRRFHDRWLTARSLAERIRSGVFLTAVGGGDDPRPADDEMSHPAKPDPNQEWVKRAFGEIYWRGRKFPAAESDLPTLKKLLAEAWIDHQVDYHNGVFKRLTERQRQLSWLAVILFAVSALVALFHSTSILESPSGPDIWGYCSVVIPAIGGAIAGYSAQREYARIAERSRQMAMHLNEVKAEVERSHRLSSLQRAALHTAVLMRTDTAQWYEVLRVHDLEVPAG